VKPLIYIAGPYSDPDPVLNTRRAIDAGMEVFDSGVAVPLIPHLTLLAHLVDPRPVEQWYRLDLGQLEHCSALLRLSGESSGADKEVDRARELVLPVFTAVAGAVAWAKETAA
jgi:hypothetical protein